MRTITINKAMNGFIVTVGCQTLVFEDADTLLEQLDDYLRNPKATETAYLERYGDAPQTGAIGGDARYQQDRESNVAGTNRLAEREDYPQPRTRG